RRSDCASATRVPLFIPTIPPPPRSTLFPYTTLFRSQLHYAFTTFQLTTCCIIKIRGKLGKGCQFTILGQVGTNTAGQFFDDFGLDRKSTRLNSSHVKISYAVFCLKKKKKV